MPTPANDLNITQTGIVVFDGISTFTGVTLTAGAGVTITNGSGISGNPVIALSGGGSAVEHLTGNSGGQLSPSGNNFNTLGTGSITIAGSGSTLTTQLTGLTNHALQVGAGTSTLTQLAPSATSGIPVISQGASADPIFGTAVVAGGGTGQVTLTNHGILIGQGTSAIASTAAGSAGQVLRSGGASADPAYSTATYPSTAGTSGNLLTSDGTNFVSSASSTFSQVKVQVFTSTGTYTPTSGMKYCTVEIVGGGGGGGGVSSTSAVQSAAAGGGGAGSYVRQTLSAATVGASQSITIGAAGTGGTNAPAAGGTGGATIFGAIMQANGGVGGALSNASVLGVSVGGVGGAAIGSTDFGCNGAPGGGGFSIFSTTGTVLSGPGGNTFFGGGAKSVVTSSGGITALSYGGGGSGAASTTSGSASGGGAGFAGICIVTEYI